MKPFSRDHGGVSCRLTIMDELYDSDAAAVRGGTPCSAKTIQVPWRSIPSISFSGLQIISRAFLRGTSGLEVQACESPRGTLPPSLPLHPSKRVPLSQLAPVNAVQASSKQVTQAQLDCEIQLLSP